MGRIGRDVIDTVRERIDIAAVGGQVVTLKKKGTSLVGLSPFHQEKTPSFNVVPAKGIFHCFGCGEGGDAFAFVMKTRGIPFADAVGCRSRPLRSFSQSACSNWRRFLVALLSLRQPQQGRGRR